MSIGEKMKKVFRSVLFLGIGGVSMHQLALAFKEKGYTVYGYDQKKSEYTNKCIEAGIVVTNRFKREYLQVDFCVKTGAIKDDNKYVINLKKLNCPIFDRAEILANLCREFKCVIAVAGTHGKSTTASIIYEILHRAGKKVSCHIGADVFAPRFKCGDDFLVVEACEYNKSFLRLKPTISVVTNVEAEHLDTYKNLFNLKTAFLTFLKRGEKRFVFDSASVDLLKRTKNVTFVSKTKLNINPKIKGEYNLNNISLAIAVAHELNIDDSTIIKAVNSFSGVPRRYEYLGKYDNAKIFIDYAHHPTELKSFIQAFSTEFPDHKIVFQPHTYSRTKMFLKEFLQALKDVKNLCIFKEYPAREKKNLGLGAHDLYLELKKYNQGVRYGASMKSLLNFVSGCEPVAFVGAGDIDKFAKKIVKSYQKNC